LNAYIIAAIPLLGKRYEFLRGLSERAAVARDFADILRLDCVVQPV
jgi:hypothetical protein